MPKPTMKTRKIIPLQEETARDQEASLWGLPERALARFGQGTIAPKAMALSPDGDYLVLGTGIGLWWYELATLSPVALWHTDCQRVQALTFAPSGEWIATGHLDGGVKVWNVRERKCFTQVERQSPQRHKPINQLAFSPDGQHLAASGAFDYLVDIYNPETGVHLAQFGDPELRFRLCWPRHPVAFSPDSRLLACAGPPKCLNRITTGHWTIAPERDALAVWDVSRGECITHLTDYPDFLYALAFSPCGKFLVASNENEDAPALTVWDTEKWHVEKEARKYGGYQLLPAYSPEGVLRVAAVSDTDVTIWDGGCHEKIAIYDTPDGDEKRRMSFSGTQFALSTTCELKVGSVENHHWSVASDNLHVGAPHSMAFLPDGKTLASGGHQFDDETLFLWNVATRSPTPDTSKLSKLPGESYHRLAPSGHLPTTSVGEKTLKVWEVGNDTPIAACGIKERPGYHAVAFSHKAQRLAYGGATGKIYVWDMTSGKTIEMLSAHETRVFSIELSPNGKYLASNPDDGYSQLWDLEHEEEMQAFHRQEIGHFAFSPCGDVIAGETRSGFVLWDIKGCHLRLTLPKPDGWTEWWEGGLACSPCGRYLAAGLDWRRGMASSQIKLWDVSTGKEIATFAGHLTHIWLLAFSSDGTLLASGGYDGTLLLWDMKPYL